MRGRLSCAGKLNFPALSPKTFTTMWKEHMLNPRKPPHPNNGPSLARLRRLDSFAAWLRSP